MKDYGSAAWNIVTGCETQSYNQAEKLWCMFSRVRAMQFRCKIPPNHWIKSYSFPKFAVS